MARETCTRFVFVAGFALIASALASTVPVSHPDLSRLEPGVRELLGDGIETLEAVPETAAPEVLAEAYGNLGMLYQAHHLQEAAELCFKNAAQLDPQNFRWIYFFGFVSQESGKLQQAVTAYGQATAIDPGYLPVRLRLGRALLADERFEEAQSVFTGALRLAGQNAVAHAGLGRIAMHEKRYSQAIEHFSQALRIEPGATQLYYPLALAYRQLGQADVARQVIARRGDREPAIVDPILREIGELTRSSQYFLEVGMAAAREGRYPAARQSFQKAVDANPDDAAARISLGQTLVLLGETEAGAEQFRLALRIDAENRVAHYRLGALLWRQGDKSLAVRHFEQSVASDPRYVPPRIYLGNARLAERDFTRAAAHYEVVRLEEPNNVVVRYRLALIRLALADCGRALERLGEARTLNANSGEVIQALVRAYAFCDATDAQRAWALEYAELLYANRVDVNHTITLAMALAANRRFAEAKNRLAQLDAAAASDPDLAAFLAALNRDFDAEHNPRQVFAPNDPLLDPPALDVGHEPPS